MDYGKFKYLEQKKAADAKSKQKIIEVKEVKFRPGTDDGDYNIKMRNLRRFISEDGDKGKVTLRFRGREITHQDIGMRMLERIRDELADVSVGRAHAQARRAPDDHGACAEEEEVSDRSWVPPVALAGRCAAEFTVSPRSEERVVRCAFLAKRRLPEARQADK